MTGMGAPQYRWREMFQSRRRNCVVALPLPSFSRRSATAFLPSVLGMPSKSPELTITPSAVKAASMLAGSRTWPSGLMTTLTGRPYLRANSKSRWSWAGTPMTAPVP